MKALEEIYNSFRPVTQFLITASACILANLDKVAAVVALVVLLFQLKANFYRAKREKIMFDKESKGE